MAKQRYTSDEVISFNSLRDYRAVGTDGTLSLSVYTGNEFVPAGTITNETSQVFTKGLRIKFELTGGSFFYVEMGENA